MRYWSSGEVESSVGDKFRIAMNLLEEKINSLLSTKSYTNEIDSLDVIYVIVKEGGLEKISYKPKSKILDLRVVIDFETFSKASPIEQNLILINGLINCLANISKNKNIKHFDTIEFRNDLKKVLIND